MYICSVWQVNLLKRERPELLARLHSAQQELRQSQQELRESWQELRELRQQLRESQQSNALK